MPKYVRGLSALSVAITKAIRVQVKNQLGSWPESGQKPTEFVRKYLHEILVPREHTYKCDNI